MRCITPFFRLDEETRERTPTPCGKCGACLGNRRIEWSFRLAEELRHSRSAFFLTLTYREEMLPVSKKGYPTLVKKDFQDFMKRFRKSDHDNTGESRIRHYSVGEYGSKTNRPHYHSIIYNASKETIENVQEDWRKKGIDIGMVHVGSVSGATIHYVTKYHVNYRNDYDPWQEKRQKEFALMSRKPGIGYQYIETIGRWHQNNNAMYVINNGFKQRMPRFYKDKVFSDQEKAEILLETIYEAEIAENKEKLRLEKLGFKDSRYEMLHRKAYAAKVIKKQAKGRDKL